MAESVSYITEDNDSFGHGTAVAGIISQTNKDINIVMIGIPGIEEGMDARTLVCVLNYIRVTQKPDVINLSLGVNICDNYDELYCACQALTDDGTIIVAAFDNSGSISYPAAFDNVIGVTSGSSLRKTNEFGFFEDEVINIVAKGGLQRVAWIGPEYILLSGNSLACAHTTSKVIDYLYEGARNRNEVLEMFKRDASTIYQIKAHNPCTQIGFDIDKAALFPFNKEMHSLVRYSYLLPFTINFSLGSPNSKRPR